MFNEFFLFIYFISILNDFITKFYLESYEDGMYFGNLKKSVITFDVGLVVIFLGDVTILPF